MKNRDQMPLFVGGTTTFLKTIVKPLLLVETLFDSVTILNIVIKAALALLTPRIFRDTVMPFFVATFTTLQNLR